MTYTCVYNLVQKAWEKLKSPIVVPDLGEAFIRKTQGLEMLLKQTRQELIDKLNPLLEEGYSYVFECIDKDNDPHIIKYDMNKIILLEVFKNQLEEKHVSYDELFNISCDLQVHLKKKELEFNNWEEFEEWKDKFRQGLSQWDCKHEGYVFEDQNGYRVKFKSSFYNFWKQMRALKDVMAGGRTNKKVYKTKEEIQVVKLMEELGRDKLKEMSIIDVEDMFYERYK
jgi:tRNA splicing ligase